MIRKAETSLGPWSRWTLDRQVWYLRKVQRLTQNDLARKAGITQARVSRMEAGSDFKWSTMIPIFAALGYEPMLLPIRPGLAREPRPYRPKWSRSRQKAPAPEEGSQA